MRMSRYSRARGRSRQGGDKNSFWLSFSDLMSALVLVIILVLFYILYQYFLMYDDYEARRDQMVILQSSLEQSEADIATQQAALDAAQSELTAAQDELDAKNSALTAAQDELTAAQNELTAAQEDLAVQQLLLEAAQRAADQTQEELDARETELQNTLTQLEQQQSQLDEQQSQIATQQSQLEQQQRQIEDLVGVRTQIISDLSTALREAEISATVDPTSGAIALASDVLFATGESQLSSEGRARIDAFLPVYLDVLFSDEYRDYVSEIIIEGHTDSVGSYIDNLLLSQQRAYNVASYVLADDYSHISDSTREHLRQVATANGRSFSDLIYNEDGTENRSASRRVVFKFRLTDEQMVSQLQSILEGSTFTEDTASTASTAETEESQDVQTELAPAQEQMPENGTNWD
ncbi:MAG TPA: OmpA family protein [Candidatus Pullichristensenella stercorigallinarum]|uniref:OmpA family protein n=1 Tax=Candidatus Pullichristensenella stercorigallinarum TaxID=2840909 RepID=A0A9D0ZPK9_9FIRM|nr:OmpA family protein [Candidatus Pullichristensenella stercorigallinarum]